MNIRSKIRNEVIQQIKNGVKEFVIYPYGNWGQIAKNTISECFGIEPVYIVDNELANYNPDIISFKEFGGKYTPTMHVILAVEDYETNRRMKNALLEFVSVDKIINLFGEEPEIKRHRLNKEDIYLNKLFVASEQQKPCTIINQKIKLRIVCSGHCTWNSFAEIAELCLEDDDFDVLIINSSRDFSVDTDYLKRKRFPYVRMEDYCAEDDRPDIVIIINPFDRLTPINYLRQYAKYVIALPVVIYNGYSHKRLSELIMSFEEASPDYYLLDSFMYREAQTMPIASRTIEMGNPKFDGIYKSCQIKSIPQEWRKLENKKIICWTTDHGVCDGMIDDCVSFDKYAKLIFEFARDNNEIGFIFRPHKKLIEELLCESYWSEKILKELIQYCDEAPNFIFDQNDSYNQAFSIADAVLSDPFCGIVLSALPLMKPICITYRNSNIYPHPYELLTNYYSARTERELLDFFEMIKQGKDPKCEQRKDVYMNNIMHFDGKNSLRVKDFMKKLMSD